MIEGGEKEETATEESQSSNVHLQASTSLPRDTKQTKANNLDSRQALVVYPTRRTSDLEPVCFSSPPLQNLIRCPTQQENNLQDISRLILSYLSSITNVFPCASPRTQWLSFDLTQGFQRVLHFSKLYTLLALDPLPLGHHEPH